MSVSAHHHHDHGPGHDHHHHGASNQTRLALALGITVLLMLVEAIGGWRAHSRALVSDAGHLLTDAVSQLLVLVAMILGARPSDARRTYGWHRLEILSALVGGFALLAVSVWLFYGGWLRLTSSTPAEIHAPLMMKIAGASLVANMAAVWLLHGGDGLNMRSAYLHVLSDASSSAAVLLAGAAIAWSPRLTWLDAALTMVIALVIIYSALRLVSESAGVLLEAVPPNIDLAGVAAALDALPRVAAVHDLHIWSIGSGRPALSAHVVVRPPDDSDGAGDTPGHDALLAQIKSLLSERFAIAHTTLQLESQQFDHGCKGC